jgi:hypothetical protein
MFHINLVHLKLHYYQNHANFSYYHLHLVNNFILLNLLIFFTEVYSNLFNFLTIIYLKLNEINTSTLYFHFIKLKVN